MAAAAAAANVVRVTNNNAVAASPLRTSGSALSKGGGGGSGGGVGGHLKTGGSPSVGGNNKTCNWQFENGEICGKTFSKSYNLVVHMRMHEDVRPFQCSLCDQTFRQKAHLQRHETTHGIGAKVTRAPGSAGAIGGGASSKRRRKRPGRASTGGITQAVSKDHFLFLDYRLRTFSTVRHNYI